MKFPRETTVVEATAILISTIIGVGVLPLGLFAAQAGNSGAPMVTVFAIVIAFVGLSMITLLGMRFPRKTIMQYSEQLIGVWLARVGIVLVIVFFAVLTGLTAREFGAVVVTSVLRETPIEVTVIVMLALSVISARHDIRTFSYIHLFYLPIVLFPVILIVFLSLKNAESLYLLPVFGNDPPDMVGGALTIAALFQGSFIMAVVIPSMQKPEKAMTASVFGLLISGGLYLLIVIAVVAVFGAEEVKNLLWPFLELAKTTALPANVLERLDALFLSVWVIAVFTTLLSSYYIAVHCLSELLHLKDHRLLTYALVPLIFILAMLPDSVIQLYEIIAITGRLGLLITIGYPALLLAVSMLRRLREDKT